LRLKEKHIMARLNREKMLAQQSSGGYNGPKTQYVDLKVDPANQRVSRRLRFIGLPISYWEYRAEKKQNPADPKSKWVPAPFIDESLYERKRFTRIGWRDAAEVAKRGVCPWEQMGYRPGKKYAIVVIERGENGEPDTVKVLNKGKQLFVDVLTQWEQDQDDDGEDITTYSGEVTYDFNLKVRFDPSQPNQPAYTLKAVGEPKPLSEDEIELLKAAYAPTAEELEAIYAEDPELREYPEWYVYGANLNRLFGPTPVKTADGASADTTPTRVTKSEDLNFGDDEDEDEKPSSKPAKPAARASAAKPASKSKNPFDEMEEEDDNSDDIDGGDDIPNF
jgi:hypothetical protein